MRFWDSSAIVPLLVEETTTDRLETLQTGDPAIVTWWGSTVECASALARRDREQRLTEAQYATGLRRLTALQKEWEEMQPTAPLRETAMRLLRVHVLQAADALQLAAALLAAEHQPAMLDFVCLDTQLAHAARREGFNIIAS